MKTETFTDGSTITTDETTENRTVVGKLAHDEYLRRIKAEQNVITGSIPWQRALTLRLAGGKHLSLVE